MEKKRSKGLIILIIIIGLAAFGAIKSFIKKAIAPSKITISSEEVYFSEWLEDNFEVNDDVVFEIDKKTNDVKVVVPLECKKTPSKEIEELFLSNGEDISKYTLIEAMLNLNSIYITPNEYDANGKRDKKTVLELLNLKEGEVEWSFTKKCTDYELEKIRNMNQLLIDLDLSFDNVDKTIHIPWYLEEKKKEENETEVIEEVIEEEIVEETVEEEPEVEEPVQEVVEGGVTPAFKEQMDAYEAFFDEYIELMNSIEKDPTLIASTKYIEFLGKYAEYTKALEEIDEANMTEADYLYYLEVNNRIQSKLLSASHNN